MKTSLLAFSLVLVAAGCGGASDDRFPAIEPADADPFIGRTYVDAPVCDDGEERPCIEVYGEHAGIKNCFNGVQTCVDGAWSACIPLSDAT